MKKDKLQNGINEIKGIRMTPLEKKRVYENVLGSSNVSNQKSVKSPWSINMFFSVINKKTMVYYVVLPLIVILTGTGVVFASEGSLPDSILYPIKVNVVEPIKGAVILSPEAKAKYESTLATKRMTEAETLASRGRLDLKNQRKINNLLENHTQALNKALSGVNQDESTEQSDEIMTNFHAEMNAHSRVLEMLTKNNGDDQKNRNNISEKARGNANKVIETLRNKKENKINEKIDENTKKDNSSKFNKKREAIESLINQTENNLSNFRDESFSQREIIDDTNRTLKEAKDFLEQADQSDKAGDIDEAYKNLIDSESSVKEADILFKAGLRYKEKDHDDYKNNNRWEKDY